MEYTNDINFVLGGSVNGGREKKKNKNEINKIQREWMIRVNIDLCTAVLLRFAEIHIYKKDETKIKQN